MLKILLGVLLFSVQVLAADKVDYMTIARTRKYRGGPDEGDLKVQAVLYQTVSTKKKKAPVKTDEPSEGF